MLHRAAVHAFVAPELDGPVSGGTLYNARLIAALQRAGVACERRALGASGANGPDADVLWIDSLYLAALPAVRASARGARIHLILHYLPSLVRSSLGHAPVALDAVELQAVREADAVLVTSRFMAELLAPHVAGDRALLCVEPGAEVAKAPSAAPQAMRCAMLCSVVENKGVLPLLRALAPQLAHGDGFTLEIAGELAREPGYASACSAQISGDAGLSRCVRLLGPLPHDEALELLRGAQLLISASRMESYGMALAEARAAGIPILACAGGHVAAHVDPVAGGELVDDTSELANRLVALIRDRGVLAERRRKAQAAARARSWDQAAAELLVGLARLGLRC